MLEFKPITLSTAKKSIARVEDNTLFWIYPTQLSFNKLSKIYSKGINTLSYSEWDEILEIGNYSLRNKKKRFERSQDLTAIDEGRGTVLGYNLDKVLDSVFGLTVVDPKGHLTDLQTMKIIALLEEVAGKIQKARHNKMGKGRYFKLTRYDVVFDEEAGANSPRKKHLRQHELDNRYEQRKEVKDHCASFSSLLSVDAYATNLVVAQKAHRGGNEDGIKYSFQIISEVNEIV
ncbi:protein stabilized1 [Tanacetum coccineum]